MDDLAARVLAHARAGGLFPTPGLALLAVSGGSDSVALLDLMDGLKNQLNLTLAIAHVDHGIAPVSSDVAEHVMALAARYAVPGYLAALNLGPDASETTARDARYDALREIQHRIGAAYLVTAHQSDDQAETVLFRVLRGSGSAGLAGIPAIGPHGLVRPLLPFSREELRDWLRRRFPDPGEAPPTHTDTANFDVRHDRAWIRHRVLPTLRERVPALESNLRSLARASARDQQAWDSLLRVLRELEFQSQPGGTRIDRRALLRYPPALAEAVLRAMAREVGLSLGPRRATRLLAFAGDAPSGRRLELGGGYSAETDFDQLRIESPTVPTEPLPSAAFGQPESGSVSWGGWEITWHPEPAGVVTRKAMSTWVSRDIGQGRGAGEIRGMRPGERLKPLGGVGHRRLCRVLMEGRVPRSQRLRYPVLVWNSAVLWVPGICRAAVAVPAPGDPAVRIDARPAPHD